MLKRASDGSQSSDAQIQQETRIDRCLYIGLLVGLFASRPFRLLTMLTPRRRMGMQLQTQMLIEKTILSVAEVGSVH